MARPKSKTELLQQCDEFFEKLMVQIGKIDRTVQLKEFPPGTLNRNIRDVLMHLYHWHIMMYEWYAIGMSGKNPKMPAEGYTWKTLPDLNRKILLMYQDIDLEDAKQKLSISHRKIRGLIENHTDEELFEKKRYHWTGSTSLGAYLISSTSSHYAWAMKLIRKATK